MPDVQAAGAGGVLSPNCSHAGHPAGRASDRSVGRAHGKEQARRVLHRGRDLTPDHHNDTGTGTGTGTGHDRGLC